MDVKLPNGVIIKNVPEGTSQEEIMSKAIDSGVATAESFKIFTDAPSSGYLMGLKDPISAGAQLLPRALETVTSLGGLVPNPVSKYMGEEARRVDEMIKAEEAGYAAKRAAEGGSGIDVGRIAGNVLNPANIAVGLKAAQGARALGVTGAGKTAMVAGGAQGALQPVLDTENFALEKATQAGLGAAASKVGEVVASGAGRVLNPLVSKAEQTMKDIGVTLTPGQILGGGFKRAEDFLQNMPLTGEAIRNAREKVLFDFNHGVINKALSKIDDQLPAKVIGRDAVDYAVEQVSNKYDDVLGKMDFTLNNKTVASITNALHNANLPSSAQRQEAVDIVNNTILNKFQGQTISGKAYKDIESDLRKQVLKYTTSTTAADKNIGDALKSVSDALKKQLWDQNQKMTPQLRRVDSAYGDLEIMKKAALSSGTDNGIFTPQQYANAVKKSTPGKKTAYVTGQARTQSISDAALGTIGKETSPSLEGRLALHTMGSLAASPTTWVPSILGAGAVSTGAYSPAGQKALEKLLTERPDIMKYLGKNISESAGLFGAATGAPTIRELRNE